jgi:tetratricopeptide (TPR) repeat protein
VAETKMTKKELREPDAFQRIGVEAQEWMKQRQRVVMFGVGGILLLGAGAALASYVSDRGENQAERELGAALKVLDRPVVEKPAPDAQPDPKNPPFTSQNEKDEAVIKSLSEFRSTRKGTQAAVTAALPLAQASYRLGKHDEALAAFDEYLKNAKKDQPLYASALEGKGYVFEAKGQLDQAFTAFDQMARENQTEFLAGMGLYHRARILILQNKKEEAAKALSEISTSHPDTAAARLAGDRLAVLSSQGVAIPTAAPPAADAGT